MVLAGEYLEPGLEIAGVRLASELQEIPRHCWSFVPQGSRDRKLRGALAEGCGESHSCHRTVVCATHGTTSLLQDFELIFP